MDDKRTGSWKKKRKRKLKMQVSKRTAPEENADAVLEQSTESLVFEEIAVLQNFEILHSVRGLYDKNSAS